MKILDLYSGLKRAAESGARGYQPFEADPELAPIASLARGWEMDVESARRWFASDAARSMEGVAREHLGAAPGIVRDVEGAFGGAGLPGVLILAPSWGEFDGFARYDRGHHHVLLGIDFPDADLDYLRALTAHELSHVYRDHAPGVWAHLGKPVSEITRAEYLEAATAQEHLVSEGLATLFSQVLYPEIPPVTHHYYDEEEWRWCESNSDAIHRSLIDCLEGDADVWSYYSSSRVSRGSPSRTQYYWAAKLLSRRLEGSSDPLRTVVELHRLAATEFEEFAHPRRSKD